MLLETIPLDHENCIFLHCGPKAMNNLVRELLHNIGINPNNIHKF